MISVRKYSMVSGIQRRGGVVFEFDQGKTF